MKKIYSILFIAALAAVNWGCPSNNNGTTGGTATVPAQPMAAVGVTSGNLTTAMTPPQLVGTIWTSNITMSPLNGICNPVHIYAYFPSGYDPLHPQTVTVAATGQPWSPSMTFTDNSGAMGGAIFVPQGSFGTPAVIVTNTTGSPLPVTVTASVAASAYRATNTNLQPVQPPGNNDLCGLGTTTFSDGAHTAVVVAEDDEITR
ncbi:MAG: hypothetical protein ACHQNE_03500 [Candidatus Kapaibacterium sp.]